MLVFLIYFALENTFSLIAHFDHATNRIHIICKIFSVSLIQDYFIYLCLHKKFSPCTGLEVLKVKYKLI
jgi:hypothetical protein